MSFLRQFARVSIFNSVLNKAYASTGLSRNLGLTIIPPSIHTMAKERAVVKEPARERKETSGDKVTKKGKSKKHTETRYDTADDKSRGGVSVNLQPVEDTSMVDSLDLEDAKSSVNKKSKIKTKSKEDEQHEVEDDKGATQGGAMFFSIGTNDAKKETESQNDEQDEVEAEKEISQGYVEFFSIDTNPTPVDLAAVRVAGAENSTGPKLNREARREIRLIEKQREIFIKKMEKQLGEDSVDEALLQKQMDKWIRKRDLMTRDRHQRKELRARQSAAARRQKKFTQKQEKQEKIKSLRTQLSKMDEL